MAGLPVTTIALGRDILFEQVLAAVLGGGKMQVGDHAGDPAVDFFRERLVAVQVRSPASTCPTRMW